MLKITKRYLSGLLALLLAVALFGTECLAQKATEEMFTKEGLEYHFLLNDTTNVSEKKLPSQIVQILEQLKPLFVIETRTKQGRGMYVDTEDRILKNNNLLLRVRGADITIKARGPSADSVLDLKKCADKKYEIDYFGEAAEYSISTEIKFKREEFDTAFSNITPEKLFRFIEGKCADAAVYLKPIASNPKVRIPGVTSQYKFVGNLKDGHPLAGRFEIEFDIWFFPPTNNTVIELAYTGEAKDRAELDKLQRETFEFLKGKKLLNF